MTEKQLEVTRVIDAEDIHELKASRENPNHTVVTTNDEEIVIKENLLDVFKKMDMETFAIVKRGSCLIDKIFADEMRKLIKREDFDTISSEDLQVVLHQIDQDITIRLISETDNEK